MPDPLRPHGDLQVLMLHLFKDVAQDAPLAAQLALCCLHFEVSLKSKDYALPLPLSP